MDLDTRVGMVRDGWMMRSVDFGICLGDDGDGLLPWIYGKISELETWLRGIGEGFGWNDSLIRGLTDCLEAMSSLKKEIPITCVGSSMELYIS